MVRKERKLITEEIYQLIISMHESGTHTFKKISEMLKINAVTVGRLIKKYEMGESFVAANVKCKKSCKERNAKLSNVDQVIFNAISCNNSHIQKELQMAVKAKCRKTLSQSTISRKLNKMKFTRKRLSLIPEERNTCERINARAIYASEISMISDENLIFLDETGFNKHTSRNYGYSGINTKAYVTVPANKGTNRSLICAIDINGIIAYKYVVGSFNSTKFVEFLEEYVIPYVQCNPNKVLVMDNVSFHKTNQVQKLLSENCVPLRYLVPYSPELNPIEEFFSMIKARYHEQKIHEPSLPIENNLQIVLSNTKYKNECEGFFRNMRRWVERARMKEPFI